MFWQEVNSVLCPGWPDKKYSTVRPDLNGPVDRYSPYGEYRKHCLLLEEVPHDIPATVRAVLLDNNLITVIRRGIFTRLNDVIFMSLSHNKIRTLERGAFIGLSSLHTFYIAYNQLVTLPSGIFKPLTSLWLLSTQDNQLTSLPVGVFDGLTSLEWLLFFHNNLTCLPPRIFNLPALTILQLTSNKLVTLARTVFDASAYPESDGHPAKVRVGIGNNPLQCGRNLCWLKEAEKDGWLSWNSQSDSQPQCSGSGTPWPDVILDCTNTYTGKYPWSYRAIVLL